jgi:hypothetical protein
MCFEWHPGRGKPRAVHDWRTTPSLGEHSACQCLTSGRKDLSRKDLPRMLRPDGNLISEYQDQEIITLWFRMNFRSLENHSDEKGVPLAG